MSAITLRLPGELDGKLMQEAEYEGVSRSEVVREAITEYLARKEEGRFMNEMIAEMHELQQDEGAVREAREMVKEAMVTDNEALDLAEDRAPGEPWPEEHGQRWWR